LKVSTLVATIEREMDPEQGGLISSDVPSETAPLGVAKMLRSIAASGVTDPRLHAAFRSVPRHRFVRDPELDRAYEDRALPIGEDQTISQPSMVALMLAALEPKERDRALEVGGGSGYAAAVLSKLVCELDTIELRPELAKRAARTPSAPGMDNDRVHLGNGEFGLAERAPFDVILVSAGARTTPRALVAQLAPGGRIAIPVGDRSTQRLLIGRRSLDGVVRWERQVRCVFVPLVCAPRAQERLRPSRRSAS